MVLKLPFKFFIKALTITTIHATAVYGAAHYNMFCVLRSVSVQQTKVACAAEGTWPMCCNYTQ